MHDASYGPFRVVRPLGSGGLGSVLLARHAAFDTPVALKILHDPSPRARAAFLDEVRACCRLDHPHIARVYDFGIAPAPWFAMELAQGSLQAEVDQTRSWRGLTTLVLQLLDALAHAHGHGVVHRDLKPANVLVADDGDLRPGLKLVDFGIAACGPTSLRRAGTPAYMAPEQFRGLSDIGPWTDLYALGALVWTLCCGQPPIRAENIEVLYERQLDGAFDPFRPRLDVPAGLEAWLRSCLHADPAGRYLCAADARMALPDADPFVTAERRWAPTSADAPTLVSTSSDATSSWDAIPGDAQSLEPTERVVRPSRCPVPASTSDLRVPSPPAPVAGAGLGVLPWRRPTLQGREHEQAQLWRLLRHVETSRVPHVVRLDGVEGVGRTALGWWLVQQVRASSGAVAEQLPEGRRLHGLVDALLQPLGRPGDAAARRRGLRRLGAETDDTLTALDALVEAYEGPRAAGMVLDLLTAIAREQTLVVVVDGAVSGGVDDVVRRWKRIGGPALLVHGSPDLPADLVLHLPPLRQAAVVAALASVLPLHPSLARHIAEESAGLPRRAMEALEDAVPSLVLGPLGFERVVEPPSPRPAMPPALTDLAPDSLEPLERLAYIDDESPMELWAQACGRDRDHLLDLTVALQRRQGCRIDRGRVRLAPAVRQTLLATSRAEGRAEGHLLAVAAVLEEHGALPHRLGQAWIDAGDVERGVGVWLDHWRRLVALRGHRVVEGMLRDARRMLSSRPPREALHGRLSTLLPLVADEGYPASDPAEALARRDEALARGWLDTACEATFYASLCTPTGEGRRQVIEQGIALIDGRCADGPWARFTLLGCSASRRWGFEPDGPFVGLARAAITQAETSRSCGEAALTTPALIDRLRPTLDALLAAHRGDHEAAVRQLAVAVQVSRTHDAETLIADLNDLAAAHVAAGDLPAAETVYEEIERLARWVGALSSESAVLAQRAGLAVTRGQWDRAARLAHQAQPGVPAGYPTAMMRLFRTMTMIDDGQVRPAMRVIDDTLPELSSIQPPDPELQRCMARLLDAMARRGEVVPDRWHPLVRSLGR